MSMLVNRRKDSVQSCCGRRRFLDLVHFAVPELPLRVHHRAPGEDASTTGSNVENEFDASLFPTVVSHSPDAVAVLSARSATARSSREGSWPYTR